MASTIVETYISHHFLKEKPIASSMFADCRMDDRLHQTHQREGERHKTFYAPRAHFPLKHILPLKRLWFREIGANRVCPFSILFF